MFGFFKKREETGKLKEEIHHSFEAVKQDFNKVGQWISYFDAKHEGHQSQLEEMKKQIFVLQNEIDEIKDLQQKLAIMQDELDLFNYTDWKENETS